MGTELDLTVFLFLLLIILNGYTFQQHSGPDLARFYLVLLLQCCHSEGILKASIDLILFLYAHGSVAEFFHAGPVSIKSTVDIASNCYSTLSPPFFSGVK